MRSAACLSSMRPDAGRAGERQLAHPLVGQRGLDELARPVGGQRR